MKIIQIVLFSLLALALSGCAATTGNRRDYPTVSVPGGSVTILAARAYQKVDGLVVSGRIKRMHKIQLPGHVDLAVCGSDGTLLVREMVRVPGLSSNRKGVIELPFRVKLAMVPPEGTTIRLRYHAPASTNGDFSCTLS
ncbi:MAG: hypothetical protein A2X84_11870 [Desulfuromonadaceae bacterium GWC2_58_13]|nr:MAG: hypothetical protein A2X84_11870 [Desulfuromonadaceae bacterium GWC2_58_13]